MKKFTGGLGDDDDRDVGDTLVWKKYFTRVSILIYSRYLWKRMDCESFDL
jgi:hypothetical protein